MVEILEELDPDPTKLKNRSLALKKTGHDPALTQPDLNKSTRIGIGTPQDKAKANLSVQFCPDILSVPKFTANLYCICLTIDLQYPYADALKISVNFGTLSTYMF